MKGHPCSYHRKRARVNKREGLFGIQDGMSTKRRGTDGITRAPRMSQQKVFADEFARDSSNIAEERCRGIARRPSSPCTPQNRMRPPALKSTRSRNLQQKQSVPCVSHKQDQHK